MASTAISSPWIPLVRPQRRVSHGVHPWFVRGVAWVCGVGVLALLGMLMAAGCAGPLPLAGGSGGAGASSEEGGRAPHFSLTTFDGRHVALSDFSGRGVILNFWASWCVPCREEMPVLEKVASESGGRGVAVLGIALRDDEASARAFLKSVKISYPTGPDLNDVIARSYQIVGLPTTIFIRPDGTIARRWPGPLSEAQLREIIRELI